MGLLMIGRRTALTAFGLLPRRLRIIIVALIAPRFTVGALVVLHRGDEMLLLRQRHHDAWAFPGGLLARGESPSACVARELLEELGVVIEVPAAPLAVLVEGTRIDIVFRTDWPYGGDAVVPHDVEVIEGRWFRHGDLPPMTGPARRALAELKRVFD
jgi:ADP-ribose pyrophosphatase YjhB (NUDIX family)